MTTFIDGPAQNTALTLKRTVKFLRVTQLNDHFDALDQPNDTPLPQESITAYRPKLHLGNCHINAGRGRSGFYPINQYQLVSPQPPDEILRDESKWSHWCHKNDFKL